MAETDVNPKPAWKRAVDWLTHAGDGPPERVRRGRLAAGLLLAAGLATIAALAISLLAGAASGREGAAFSPGRLAAGVMVMLLATVYMLNRRGRLALAGVSMALLLLGVNLFLLARSGPLSPPAATLVLPVIVAGMFGPPLSAAVVAGLAGLAYLGLNLAADPAYFRAVASRGPALQTLLVYLNLTVVGLVAWFFARTTWRALEESRTLSHALAEQRREMMALLDVQTYRLQAAVSVVRAIVGERNLDRLLDGAAQLLRDTFGYHHVQVFLMDEGQGYAAERHSADAVGQRLPAGGSLSVIEQVTATGRPVIACDTNRDPVHGRTELLPHARSEIALPLAVGGKLIGALDLQSVERDAFNEDTIPVLQALADQLAVAIENARLFEQAEVSLREIRGLGQDIARRSWSDFLAGLRGHSLRRTYGPEPEALRAQRSRLTEQVLSSGSVIMSTGRDGQPAFLAAPIVVRSEVIGVLGVEPYGSREWTQADLQLLQGIAERTALAVENVRLYIQARRAAEREHILNQIAQEVQGAGSVDQVLQAALAELSQALGASRGIVQISPRVPEASGSATRRAVPENVA